ncbi:MAG TPA: discoidin domain-containing protein [Polyangia bacterium]|nr:discoidin domain-containing protein [Polyangia bacterium]
MVQVQRPVRVKARALAMPLAMPARSASGRSLAALLLIAAGALGCRASEHFDPQRILIGSRPPEQDATASPGTGGTSGGGGGGSGGDNGTGGAVPGIVGSSGGAPVGADDGPSSIDLGESPDAPSSQPDRDALTEAGGDTPVDHCDRTLWTATASVWKDPVRSLAGAIDGDLTTRWGTGRNQDGTDWYQVDFGERIKLSGITLNNQRAFPGDYPGGYAVYESSDGTTFRGPFVTGEGTVNMTVIQFPERTVRAIQIKQTGTARSAFWWQIGEFQVDCERQRATPP